MTRISAYRLRHAAQVYGREPAAALGFDKILEAVGVAPDVLADANGRVDLQREAAALETACDALQDPTFAARAGLASPGAKTLLAYLAQASDNVGQVFRFAQRFYALEDPDLSFELDGDEHHPTICLKSDIIGAHQFPRHREFLVFGLLKRTEQIAGPGFGRCLCCWSVMTPTTAPHWQNWPDAKSLQHKRPAAFSCQRMVSTFR